jgi:hypothetical protein
LGRVFASFGSGLTKSVDTRAWLISGASSGIGRAITEAALARGDLVAAGARTADALGDLPKGGLPLALDVTDPDQGEAAVAETIERFGRVDVLVNNAGRTQVGAVEETADEELLGHRLGFVGGSRAERRYRRAHSRLRPREGRPPAGRPGQGCAGDPDCPRRRRAAAAARPWR